MKKYVGLMLFSLFALMAPLNASAEFQKTKIAVLDFQLQGDGFETKDMGAIVAEWFITALVKEGRFDVVERRLLKKILEEQQLVMAGVVDESSATQIGKLLGVKVIISGSVMKLADVIEINARIIDVGSASIIAAESVKSSRAISLQDLVVQMSEKIIKNFPLEGYIVNRSGNSLTIDLGKLSGVKAGMKFVAFKEGTVIKHPKTGEVLDVEHIKTGELEITSVRGKLSEAKILKELKPGAIDYGQLVNSIVEQLVPSKGRLYVSAEPKEAKVRILNIVNGYLWGMELEAGSYHLEITADGYEKVDQWITLNPGEDKKLTYILGRVQQPVAYQAPPQAFGGRPSPEALKEKYIRDLKSYSVKAKTDAAKKIIRAGLYDEKVLDVIADELMKGYKDRANDRNHVDAMAWLCKALGASGIPKYQETLRIVAKEAPNRKLKKYAQQNIY